MEKYPIVNFNVVLVEPEIPANTGNIGRTCVGSWSRLHLIGPLGFEITDKRVRRAGLDYWADLDLKYYESFSAWWQQLPSVDRVFFFSTKAKRSVFDQGFQQGDWLVFGRETKGLPEELIATYPSQCLKIPFPGPIRSLNLATAVAISVFEGLRQLPHGSPT